MLTDVWKRLQKEIRAESGDPEWELRDAEPVVVQWFELLPHGPQDR